MADHGNCTSGQVQENVVSICSQKSQAQTIVASFELQAMLHPDKIAVYQHGEGLDYGTLNRRANALARRIVKSGYQGKNVALLAEHGQDAIVGIFGILKSGNCYVPLDSDFPIERLKYILRDAGCRLLAVTTSMLKSAQQLAGATDGLEVINLAGDGIIESGNLSLEIKADDPAYILYASGSAGQPKGVIQNQRNVLHFNRVYTENIKIQSKDRISLLPSYTFDASVMDIYGALLCGASLYPYDIKKQGYELLPHWIEQNQISIFYTVPSVYRNLIIALSDHILRTVRMVVLGGEVVYKNDFENFKTLYGFRGVSPTAG